ncbi:hypothetical protein [Arthrobacter sp. ISL-69]|uniref:hypothetical protein n=1 Tax=Arthrobacter sp. ISL-69 TaxID=2819113 RepID=UPI001BEAA780|nr:hypothetical protein [Arthrobacter sp. ISL-69]MBT2534975.1 hypothetical protein [Arthrobacter sp. ISL-69]
MASVQPATPQRRSADSRGLAAGITSLASAVLAPVAAMFSLSTFIMAAAEPLLANVAVRDTSGYWVMLIVLVGLLAGLVLTSVITGIVAIKRSDRMSAGRITGLLGLAFTAFNLTGGLWTWAGVAGPWFTFG